ncbi:MAG: Hpt domain-containing protein, partial [Defluviitaleaceae bacterium]|nr:Hpt domain-containing protein [Defluviitaleaceae bacterium]
AAKTTILEEVAIAGLDMQKGIEMTGGSEELYLGVLESFYENAQRLSKELQICADAGDTKLYAIHVHGIKSTSGTIGADEISQFAKALETAAVNDSLDFVRANNTQFLQNLAELLDNIYPLVMVELSKKVDKDAIQKALQQMKSALFSNNQADIDEQTKNLQQYLLAEGIGNQINKVLQNKMAGNFEAAISLIDTITEGATQ